MVHDAKRRIRGRAGGPSGVSKPRTPLRDGRPGLGFLIIVSAAIHALVLTAVIYLPGLLPGHERPVKLFTVTLANMPPGPKGGGGQETRPVKPEPKPVKEPKAKEPEPVKIAAKPPEKKPEPKKEPEKEPEPQKPVAPVGPGQGPVGGGKPGEKAAEGPVVLEGGLGQDLGPYSKVIENKVSRNWRQPVIASRKKPRVTVFFKINQRGIITDVKTEISSGIPMVDRLAESAVKNSNPLPPLPPDLDVDSIGVHYTFVVTD